MPKHMSATVSFGPVWSCKINKQKIHALSRLCLYSEPPHYFLHLLLSSSSCSCDCPLNVWSAYLLDSCGLTHLLSFLLIELVFFNSALHKYPSYTCRLPHDWWGVAWDIHGGQQYCPRGEDLRMVLLTAEGVCVTYKPWVNPFVAHLWARFGYHFTCSCWHNSFILELYEKLVVGLFGWPLAYLVCDVPSCEFMFLAVTVQFSKAEHLDQPVDCFIVRTGSKGQFGTYPCSLLLWFHRNSVNTPCHLFIL